MALLQAENIVKQFAGHTALSGVSVTFPENCIYGLLGPNGAGKTTLIRIITQITAPDSGVVTFKGGPLKSDHVYDMGYLPEERGLYKKMTVSDQAMYLAQLKGLSTADAKKELKKWFEKFGIADWWNKKVEELSKGMAQKVQFITTVIHKPKLIILDEPFSGFDPINANLIKGEILKLKEEGATIILSTHNMSSVEEICEHIALINKSKKLLEGSVQDIRNQYSNQSFAIWAKGDESALSAALANQYDFSLTTENNSLKVSATLKEGQNLNSLLQTVLPVAEVHKAEEIIPSMNDIFINAVNHGIDG